MAASKLKNRKRFITRDVRLDIPEDQELTISPLDDATSQHECLFPHSTPHTSPPIDRTWPRRTWRAASDFAQPIGQRQNSVLNAALTLPRFNPGSHEAQSALARSGHCAVQPTPPSDWRSNGGAIPTSSSDARWHFRSLSDVVPSTCLSAASPPSETASEPCFQTNCHDGAVYDAGSLSSRNSNVSSRNLTTTSALGSVPELTDDQTISSQEMKRRSHSLNESSAYSPLFDRVRTNRSLHPGSVLQRALTWEMAGKSQPFRVTVSPISDPKSPDCGFRRNASSGKLHVIQATSAGRLEPSNVRNSSSASAKGVYPGDNPWTIKEEGLAVVDCDRAIRLSPVSTRLRDWNGERRTEQCPWNSVHTTQRSEQDRETIGKNLRNGFDSERLEQNTASGNNGFRATEFKALARVSPVKTNRSSSGPVLSRKEAQNLLSVPSSTFRNSRSDELDSSRDFLCVPRAKKTFRVEAYDDADFYPSRDDSSAQSISASRKPFRSKSLRLLNSEAMTFTLGKDSDFQRPLSDWKTDSISLSTPNSPQSPPAEVGTAPKQIASHSLTKPCLSMITLNMEPTEHTSGPDQWNNIRSKSMTRSATNLLGNAAPQSTRSTWGPFVVADHRKAVSNPVELSPLSGRIKPITIKPLGTNFVVRRITNLSKNPFNPISTVEDPKNGRIKPGQSLTTTNTINAQNPGVMKPLTAVQYAQKEQTGQSPTLAPSELERSYKTPVEITLGYDDSILSAGDEKHVPWSGIPTWDRAPKTSLDDVYSPSNCGKVTSSEDMGYGGSAAESSPTVTSEKVTVHLTEPKVPLQRNEDRATDGSNDSSSQVARNSSEANGEPSCSRLIRVFLKSSSSQLTDKTSASHMNKAVSSDTTECRSINTEWTNEASKANFDDCPLRDRNVGAGIETDAKAHDSVVTVAETSPKATHAENWRQKVHVNRSPPPQENGGSSFKEQQKQNGEIPASDWDANTCPVTRSGGQTQIKGSDAGSKKTFEIVKKKLIIPEPMTWFRSTDDKSKSQLQPTVTSRNEQDLRIIEGRDIADIRIDEKVPDAFKLAGTVHDCTEISHKSVLKSNRPKDGGNISCIASVPSKTELSTACILPMQSTNVVETVVSVIPSNLALTFDTGISIYPDITRNSESTNDIDRAATTLGDINEPSFEMSANEFHLDAVCGQLDEDLAFLNSWDGVVDSEKKCEPIAANLLSKSEAPLVGLHPAAEPNPTVEEQEAKEIQAILECSIMTELDQAIERLTSTRPLDTKATPTDIQTNSKTPDGLMSLESSLTPWQGISQKLTQVFSDQKNRQAPIKMSPMQDKPRVTVSTALGYSEQKPPTPFSSFQSSCKPIAPLQVMRLSQNDVHVEGKIPTTDKRNQWMILAREDSFNRPDSPMFRKTLPLPKDSVIMRHRMHQKELGCSGGGAGSVSSSESSEDDSPALRVAPRRTRKSRSISTGKGMAGVKAASEEDDERNGERDSIVSSTTSIRALSLDSSFLSEDNM